MGLLVHRVQFVRKPCQACLIKRPYQASLLNDAPDPNTPINQIPLAGLLDVAVEAMLVEFRAELDEAGYADIRPTHGCVFRFVHEDGMRLTELADLAGMTKQSVGEIVDDLAELGYVERIPDPADRRAKLIRLTAKGEDAQTVGFGLFAKLEAALGRALRRRAHRRAARAPRRDRRRPRPRTPSPSSPAPSAPPPPRPRSASFRDRAAAHGPSETSRGRSSAG